MAINPWLLQFTYYLDGDLNAVALEQMSFMRSDQSNELCCCQ